MGQHVHFRLSLWLLCFWSLTLAQAQLAILKVAESAHDNTFNDVAADSRGLILLAGHTQDRSGPSIALSSDRSHHGFINWLDHSGQVRHRLLFAGTDASGVSRLALDRKGRVVLAGVVQGTNGARLFLAKLDAGKSNLLFQTLIGDSLPFLQVLGLSLDDDDNVVVAGQLLGSLPAMQSIGPLGQNYSHPFVAKFNEAGQLQFTTVLGGGSYDGLRRLTLDASGDIYLAGDTYSGDFPTQPRSFPASFDSFTSKWFVTKLAHDGKSQVFSTVLHWDCGGFLNGLALDSQGDIYLGGQTSSRNLPTLREPDSPAYCPGSTASGVLVKLAPDGTNLLSARFAAAPGLESITDLDLHPHGGIAAVGNVAGPGLPGLVLAGDEPSLDVRRASPRAGSFTTLERLHVLPGGKSLVLGHLSSAGEPYGARQFLGVLPLPHPDATNPLAVSLSSPVRNQILNQESPTILRAAVFGDDQARAVVRFFDGQRLLGVTTNVPHELTVSNWTRGSHTLRVEAMAGTQTVRSQRVPILIRSVPNDHFTNRIQITGERIHLRGRVAGVTSENSYNSYSPDAWWTWTAPRDGRYEIEIPVNTNSLALAVYTGENLEQLRLVGGPYYWNHAPLIFDARAGTNYQIQVTSFHGDFWTPRQSFQLRLRRLNPPANDAFTNATVLRGLPLTVRGDLHGATMEPGESGFGIHAAGSVWYRWQAPQRGLYRIELSSASGLTSVVAYRGEVLGSLSPAGANVAGTADYWFHAEAGETIRLSVRAQYYTTNFTLHLRASPEARNDDFAKSRLLSGVPAAFRSSSLGASREEGEPENGFSYSGSVWWHWQAPTTGVYRASVQFPAASDSRPFGPIRRVTVAETVPSSDYLPLQVFTGETLSGLQPVSLGNAGRGVVFRAEAGVLYRFSLNDSSLPRFDFVISPASPPSNDDFTWATVLTGSNLRATGTLHQASFEDYELLNPIQQPSEESVWYRWTVPSNGLYSLSFTNDSHRLRLFQGPDLTNLSPIAVLDQRQIFRFEAGAEYSLSVERSYWFSGNSHDAFVLHLDSITPPSNDDRTNALELTGRHAEFQGNGYNATSEADELVGFHSLWWHWTAPTGGWFRLRATGLTKMSVFAVTNGTELLRLAEDASVTEVAFQIAAGTECYLGVASAEDRLFGYALDYLPPPPNDDFERAQPITLLPYTTTNYARWATRQEGEPNHSSWSWLGRSLWWSWTPTNDQTVLLEPLPNWPWTPLAVYSGTDWTNLLQEAAGDPSFVFRVRAGTTYHLAADAPWAPYEIGFSLRSIDRPANDDFSQAAEVRQNHLTGSFTGATVEADESMESDRGSVWWHWRAPTSGVYTVESTVLGYYQRTLDIFTGSALTNLPRVGPLPLPIEHLIDRSPVNQLRRHAFTAETGLDYWIRLAAPLSTVADYSAQFTLVSRPGNDDFTNRIHLAGAFVSASATNTLATVETDELPYSEWFVPTRTLWWSWTAPSNGAWSITVERSPAAAAVYVFTGTELTNLAPALTAGSPIERLFLQAQAGLTYAIQVQSNPNVWEDYATGKVILDLAPAPAPANDNFASRTRLFGTNVLVGGANSNATAEVGEPFTGDILNLHSRQSVWFAWRPPFTGTALFAVGSSNATFTLAVFTGTSLSNLQFLGSNEQDFSALELPVEAHAEYQIRLDGFSSPAGEFALSLRNLPPELVRQVADSIPRLPTLPGRGVIETSTNLIHWVPFQTNHLDSLEFRPPLGQEPRRFFRRQLAPTR